MTWWFLTCHRFTVAVAVDVDGNIADGAPIIRKFIGQPATNLGRWMRSIGGFELARI